MDYREELLRTPQILERVMEEKQEAALTRAPLLVFCGCGTSFISAVKWQAFAAFREDGRWR